MPIVEHCLRCGKSWSREPQHQRHACPGCGDSHWDSEPTLDNLGKGTEYAIVRERSGRGLILTLELQWTQNEKNNANAVLSHRLKARYRHMKGDLGVKDGRECVIVFDRMTDDRWDIVDLRRKDAAIVRRESAKEPALAVLPRLGVDPLTPHRGVITGLRVQAETLLRGAASSSATQSASRSAIQKEIWGGIGGAVTGELLGSTRIGTTLGRAAAADAQARQRAQAQEAARQSARFLVHQARQLVEVISGALGHRLAQSLLRVLAEAESARNPQTSARKVLLVVNRLESWRPSANTERKSRFIAR